MRTLVVGCDASGKSSLVEAISGRYGDLSFESTSTDESRRFKHDNLDTLIDNDFVSTREELYMRLARTVLDKLAQTRTGDYIGTDSTLVTRLSHSVMRSCISDAGVDYGGIVEEWIKDEAEFDLRPPDIVAMTYAPFDTIHARIKARIDGGDRDEKFWGFNSPFFLKKYQDAWLETRGYLFQAGVNCVSFDTTRVSIEESLSTYSIRRDAATTSSPTPPPPPPPPPPQIPHK